MIPAIVLAAGLSSRMAPRFKPLLPLADRPMLAHVLDVLHKSNGLGPIFVVTGHRADDTARIAKDAGATPIHNPDFQTGGMLSSITVALKNLPHQSSHFLLCLGDQPALAPETIESIINISRTPATLISIPAYHGKRGHPVLFSTECVPEILHLDSGMTLKSVTERHPTRTVEVPVSDPAVVSDVDTPADYARLLNDWQSKGADHVPLAVP